MDFDSRNFFLSLLWFKSRLYGPIYSIFKIIQLIYRGQNFDNSLSEKLYKGDINVVLNLILAEHYYFNFWVYEWRTICRLRRSYVIIHTFVSCVNEHYTHPDGEYSFH